MLKSSQIQNTYEVVSYKFEFTKKTFFFPINFGLTKKYKQFNYEFRLKKTGKSAR